jgi:hypothetical protein
VIFLGITRFDAFGLATDRFEEDVKLRSDAESGSDRRFFDLRRAKVVEHDGISIQERLDIEQLPGPISFLEDPLAAIKVSLLQRACFPGSRQIV